MSCTLLSCSVFGVDPEVHAFIRATWQGSYWGPWTSWRVVPDDKRDSWWHSFIQNYYWEDEFHDEIYLKWKVHKSCRRAKILANGSTPEFKAKEKQLLNPALLLLMGRRCTSMVQDHGALLILIIVIMIDEGLEEPLSYPDLVRKTHSNADGSFIDKRARLSFETEQAVEEIMTQDGSSDGSIISKRFLLNQEYIKRAQTSKGNIYGLGSVQHQTTTTSKSVPASLSEARHGDPHVWRGDCHR
ncbi:hypothetical protein Bca101_056556 [Brassica carinata]